MLSDISDTCFLTSGHAGGKGRPIFLSAHVRSWEMPSEMSDVFSFSGFPDVSDAENELLGMRGKAVWASMVLSSAECRSCKSTVRDVRRTVAPADSGVEKRRPRCPWLSREVSDDSDVENELLGMRGAEDERYFNAVWPGGTYTPSEVSGHTMIIRCWRAAIVRRL